MDKFRQWLYYFIIGFVSLISLFFLPMLGSTAGLSWNIPNTPVGWVVWVVTKLIVAILNIIVFHCFMLQAKVNIADNEKYKKANEILLAAKKKERLPRSPERWTSKQYFTKGVSIFLFSVLSAVALTQAILTFDWVSMLTYLFTIIFGIIFGVLQMKAAEAYWTGEYYEYALMIEKESELSELAANSDNSIGIDTGTVDNSGCSQDADSASESTQERQGELR